jgi:nucleoside-diphosphate-sugar epimerase
VETAREVIAALRGAAPEGRGHLDEQTLCRLRALTRSLLAASPEAKQEYARFLAITERGLPLPAAALAGWLGGKRILVTGGTGCIGSALMNQLAAVRPARLVSLSRGATAGWPVPADAEYARADIRDLPGLAAVVADVRPDVLFHVAAQRDPGLAERDVHRTVTTNVLGTRNVITAAERCDVPQVVYASTGKALRPYSPDVYAASKRAAEWLLAQAAAGSSRRFSAARFTHVVDNSIIHQLLLEWSAGGVVRLHGSEILFYAQSALESAQLLLCAGLGASGGRFLVNAITDLGWPVSLLDLALGVLGRTGSQAPVYISGYDPGYEDMPFPGLYDPRTAGEVSPLLSGLEAERAEKAASPAADVFQLELAPDPEPDKLLQAVEETCEVTQDPATVRAALDALSWALLNATLRAAPATPLARAAARAAPHRDRLGTAQLRMLAAIERQAGLAGDPLARD